MAGYLWIPHMDGGQPPDFGVWLQARVVMLKIKFAHCIACRDV
mgnify:CR=1 FL=1